MGISKNAKKKPKNTHKKKKITSKNSILKPVTKVNFGPVTANNTGTKMEATGLSTPKYGSTPKVYPTNWKEKFGIAIGALSNSFIRGHLLNDNLGGEGDSNNLVPLTRSANSFHEKNVEKPIKKHVMYNKYAYANYEVKPKYDNPTKIIDSIDEHLKEQSALEFYKDKQKRDEYIKKTIPEKLECKWQLFTADKKAYKVKIHKKKSLDVGNEF